MNQRETRADQDDEAVRLVPVALSYAGERVLIAGGTAALIPNVDRLLASGAEIDWVDPPPDAVPHHTPIARVLDREPADADLARYRLIIAAMSRERTRALVTRARQAAVPVYGLHDPLSTAALPVSMAEGGAQAAVFSLSEDLIDRLVAQMFPALLPTSLARLRTWARQRHEHVTAQLPLEHQQTEFWRNWFTGSGPGAVLAGRWAAAEQAFDAALEDGKSREPGEVYLIGAGPGDPELLTLRALRLLRSADVVLYDRLVGPAVLEQCPAGAERVYVGKRRDRHPVPQASINDLLATYALSGKRVARLKGGDPFVFGRGGEEIEYLLQQGVPFQVVPGITAANGCAAYAGIPLTHRDYAQSCVFATGHRRGDGDLDLDFAALVRPAQTLVIYMGLQALPRLSEGLIAHGMAADMPAALVQQGTTENQRVVVAPLHALAARAHEAQVRAPTLVIVGEVVRLRRKLAWFDGGGEGGFWED